MYKPTVIGNTESVKQKVTPTVFSSGIPEKGPKIEFKVSTMAGVQRKFLEFKESELKQKYPSMEDVMICKLKERLLCFVPECITLDVCNSIGKKEQESFTAIVSCVLAFIRSPELKNGQRHIERLKEVLSSSVNSLNDRGIFSWKSDKKNMESLLVEINQIEKLLKTFTPTLESTIDKISKYDSKLAGLIQDLMVEVMVVDVLKDHVKDEFSDVIIARGISISTSLSQMKDQHSLHKNHIDSLKELLFIINETLYNQIPSLVQCMMETEDITETQRYVLSEKMKTFIQHLERK
ncbi:MAG TPA: hypothetical protein VFM18_03930 [Methanosarcina sp.]|nr:hypothetical protein [Methanosarcina sp.]